MTLDNYRSEVVGNMNVSNLVLKTTNGEITSTGECFRSTTTCKYVNIMYIYSGQVV